MKKDTRIIIGISIVFLLAAGILLIRQQMQTASLTDGFVTVQKQTASPDSDSLSDGSEITDTNQTEECAVYVSGAVKHSGLYRYSGTARVSDAVEGVGGFAKGADKEAVNLARILNDGEQICIPTKKETAAAKRTDKKDNENTYNKNNNENLIDINKASLEELMTLPGIGEAKANLIIQYRAEQGLFTQKEDLMKISGIKEGVYNKIKDLIMIT